MRISIIVAMSEARAIGLNDGLPWRLSTDLKRFKALTLGHHLIVGRVTYETIGRPLPGRTMIILTRNPAFEADGCHVVSSLDQALSLAEQNGEQEVFIGGGAEIYAQTLAIADRMYVTWVHAEVPADTFFPPFNLDNWVETTSIFVEADQKNQHPTTFQVLERVKTEPPDEQVTP